MKINAKSVRNWNDDDTNFISHEYKNNENNNKNNACCNSMTNINYTKIQYWNR